MTLTSIWWLDLTSLFGSFDVASHFSALRPTYSCLPYETYSHTEITQVTHGRDQRSIITLFVSWLVKRKIVVRELVTRSVPPPPPLG